jgi:uncharacterized protein (TIGR02996 family)
MSLHPDADAFIKAILDNPADITTRLVFADWLEESGEFSNVAWARYIRLKEEAIRHAPNSSERQKLKQQATAYASGIKTKLAIPAVWLGERLVLLRQLLPVSHLKPMLAGYELSQGLTDLLWEFIARQDVIMPLAGSERCLWLAMADPTNIDRIRILSLILRKEIVPVQASAEEIQAAVNFYY